jgi:hypothetical protein
MTSYIIFLKINKMKPINSLKNIVKELFLQWQMAIKCKKGFKNINGKNFVYKVIWVKMVIKTSFRLNKYKKVH